MPTASVRMAGCARATSDRRDDGRLPLPRGPQRRRHQPRRRESVPPRDRRGHQRGPGGRRRRRRRRKTILSWARCPWRSWSSGRGVAGRRRGLRTGHGADHRRADPSLVRSPTARGTARRGVVAGGAHRQSAPARPASTPTSRSCTPSSAADGRRVPARPGAARTRHAQAARSHRRDATGQAGRRGVDPHTVFFAPLAAGVAVGASLQLFTSPARRSSSFRPAC